MLVYDDIFLTNYYVNLPSAPNPNEPLLCCMIGANIIDALKYVQIKL